MYSKARCNCDPQQTRLFDTPVVLEDILGNMTRYILAHREAYPEINTKFKQLETAVTTVTRKRVESQAEAEPLIARRLRNAESCLYRKSDLTSDAPLRAKRGGELIVEAGINQQTLLAEFPEFVPAGSAPPSFDTPVGYHLIVKLHLIKCIRETSPTTFSDDIVIRADWSYAGDQRSMPVFEYDFDDGTQWPPAAGPEWLVGAVQVKRGATSFIATGVLFEEDLLDADDAEEIAKLITFVLDLAVELAKGALKATIEEKIDNSNLSGTPKEALKAAIGEGIDKAGDNVKEDIKKDGQSWIAEALRDELFDPFPFGIRVNIDWSFPRLPPSWETWLNHVRVSERQFAPGQFVSHELEFKEQDGKRGKYTLQVSYYLYEDAI
jgi:hypothetical protein